MSGVAPSPILSDIRALQLAGLLQSFLSGQRVIAAADLATQSPFVPAGILLADPTTGLIYGQSDGAGSYEAIGGVGSAATTSGTWFSKPSAKDAGVGARFMATDWNNSMWVSNGRFWRPDGRQVVMDWRLGASVISNSLSAFVKLPIWASGMTVLAKNVMVEAVYEAYMLEQMASYPSLTIDFCFGTPGESASWANFHTFESMTLTAACVSTSPMTAVIQGSLSFREQPNAPDWRYERKQYHLSAPVGTNDLRGGSFPATYRAAADNELWMNARRAGGTDYTKLVAQLVSVRTFIE